METWDRLVAISTKLIIHNSWKGVADGATRLATTLKGKVILGIYIRKNKLYGTILRPIMLYFVG